jgi:hypothetical protein
MSCDWYVYVAHVYDALVHSHIVGLEAFDRGGIGCYLARVSGLWVTDMICGTTSWVRCQVGHRSGLMIHGWSVDHGLVGFLC